jgi:hypothetical protein
MLTPSCVPSQLYPGHPEGDPASNEPCEWGLPEPLGPTAPSLGLSLAPFQGALTAFITGAIFREIRRLSASPGLLALALPSLSMNRGKIGGLLSPLHTFPPPEGLPTPTSPCRVYAGIPGDHRNSMHAGPRPRPFLSLPLRKATFAKMGDLHLLRTFPVPWERRCYRRCP